MTSNIDKVLHRALGTLRSAEARALPETLSLSEALQLDFDINITFDEHEVFEDLAYGRDDEEAPPETPSGSAVRRLPLELS